MKITSSADNHTSILFVFLKICVASLENLEAIQGFPWKKSNEIFILCIVKTETNTAIPTRLILFRFSYVFRSPFYLSNNFSYNIFSKRWKTEGFFLATIKKNDTLRHLLRIF